MQREWETEPNRKEFKHLGFDCLINRNSFGAWCGYVAVPKGHPWFEKSYGDLEDLGLAPEVHGGLTYSNHCQGEICHQSETEDEVWWLGFDCAHAGDLMPAMVEMRQRPDWPKFPHYEEFETYRNQEYVTEETMKLAQQVCQAGMK